MKVCKSVIEVDGSYPRTVDRLDVAAQLAVVLAADFNDGPDDMPDCPAAAAIKATIVHLLEMSYEREDEICDEAAESLLTDAGPISPCVGDSCPAPQLDACGGGGCQ